MPDRVKLPKSLPRSYKSVSVQIIEQQNPAVTARSALKAVQKDIRKMGQGAKNLMTHIEDYIRPVCQDSLLRRVSDCWDDIYREIDLSMLQSSSDRNFMEWGANACRQVVMRLEQGDYIDDPRRAIKKQFMINVWKGRFVDPFMLLDSHTIDLDDEARSIQLELVSQCFEQEIDNSFEPSCRNGTLSVDNLLEVDIMDDF